ncbi:erv26 superfamily protein [Thecaphora frezii]
MFLSLFSLAFAAVSVVALLLCVALGLQRACQFIESHASYSRRCGLRLIYASVAIQLGIIIVDSVPLWPLLPSLTANVLHWRSVSRAAWPFAARGANPTNVAPLRWTQAASTVLSLVLPLASHVMLTRHHNLVSHSWHLHRYDHAHRPRLPGGRLDWDVAPVPPDEREMTVLELIAVLGFCVWTVPVWRFLGSCAAMEWSLPLGDAGSHALSHGGRKGQ